MKSLALFVPLLAAASATAHGFVSQITINGKVYKGPKPNGAKMDSIIRQISDPSPIKGAHNPSVNCGTNSKPATLVADAPAGAALTFSWNGADMSLWPHNTGPTLTYMASCGSQTCDKFDSTQAKWFKIGQEGRKANGDWVQADIKNGAPAHAQIPANLAPGNYLVRHEIIALHLATSPGGAEFYAACAQLKVTGNGNGQPKPDQLVSLPGAYSDNDPGIFDKNVFDSRATYTFPGPAVVTLTAGSAPAGNNGTPQTGNNTPQTGNGDNTPAENDDNNNEENNDNNEENNNEGGNEEYPNEGGNGKAATGTTTEPAPAPAGSGKPKNSSGSCKKKSASTSVAAAASTATPGSQEGSEGTYYPRSISRIFGRHHAIAQGLQRPSH